MVATLYTVYLKNIRRNGLQKYTFTHHSLPTSHLNRYRRKKREEKLHLQFTMIQHWHSHILRYVCVLYLYLYFLFSGLSCTEISYYNYNACVWIPFSLFSRILTLYLYVLNFSFVIILIVIMVIIRRRIIIKIILLIIIVVVVVE